MENIKEKIWKVIGQDIDPNATSAEAIKQAGLDFQVSKCPNIHVLPSGREITSGNSFFTFRTDTEAILGSKIGKDYQILQNTDAFAFFDNIVGGPGGIQYETAGALGYGETIFITVKLSSYIRVGRDDLIDEYLFLTSTHDGSGSITIAFTPVRIWCANTLTAALKNCSNQIKIRHTASASEKLKSAHHMLGLSEQLSTDLEDTFNHWSRVRISDPEVKKLIQLAMMPNKESYEKLKFGRESELSTYYTNIVDNAFDYAMTAESQQGATTKGTLFGAYNAVTGYYQNVRNFKDDDSKFKAIMHGTALERSQVAFNLCADFATHGSSILRLN
ncbi:DUF932 domain-containing protein [Pedobacter sp. SYP-B3415]|uniref:DUF932 domain-containing protein n=1 Tax=Pedobacter sp. SYP-B3415 TaxID=2496641 RepID=UPI00101BDA0E|nr:DUF932 domain-containing protein [Pedobacter sp. SYP-B3415]